MKIIRLFILIMGSVSIYCRANSLAFFFPEERIRHEWDRQCLDWPVQIPGAAGLQRNPIIYTEKTEGLLRVLTKITLKPEPGETVDGLAQSVENILTVGNTYPEWVLPGINEKPSGGSYFVEVSDLKVGVKEKGRNYVLTGGYAFNLLWFQKTGQSSLEFIQQLETPPQCEFFAGLSAKQIRKITFRMTPRENVLKYLMAELWIVAREREVELRMRLVSKAAPLLYQLLPEAMVKSELDMRGRRIFENFVDLRRTSFSLARTIAVSKDSLPKVAPRAKQ